MACTAETNPDAEEEEKQQDGNAGGAPAPIDGKGSNRGRVSSLGRKGFQYLHVLADT